MGRKRRKDLIDLLTVRERMIAELVAEGLGNRGIGQRLGISEHTVRWRLTLVMRKLGVSNRTSLAVHMTKASRTK
jgi:DNA-binding NarL/FixJ family response regulator